jgi:hypothetical protein
MAAIFTGAFHSAWNELNLITDSTFHPKLNFERIKWISRGNSPQLPEIFVVKKKVRVDLTLFPRVFHGTWNKS